MSIVGIGIAATATHSVTLGALSVPYFPGSRLSVLKHDGYADTIAIGTATGNIALNLYAAGADGLIPGYLGSCLRYLSSEDLDASGVELISDTEIGGSTTDGIHIRFIARPGPRWMLRCAVRAPQSAAAATTALARDLVATAVVHAPRHHRPGAVVELDEHPTWTTLPI